MSDIAERALAAHAADEEQARLRKEAEHLRLRGLAVEAIAAQAEAFGLIVDPETIEGGGYSRYVHWTALVPVDDDVDLLIKSTPAEAEIQINVRAADQLYWDLPPGQTARDPGAGGVYGCFGLSPVHEKQIGTLADLGWAITMVRNAREAWMNKHATEETT